MMKRILVMLLILCLGVSLLPVTATAQAVSSDQQPEQEMVQGSGLQSDPSSAKVDAKPASTRLDTYFIKGAAGRNDDGSFNDFVVTESVIANNAANNPELKIQDAVAVSVQFDDKYYVNGQAVFPGVAFSAEVTEQIAANQQAVNVNYASGVSVTVPGGMSQPSEVTVQVDNVSIFQDGHPSNDAFGQIELADSVFSSGRAEDNTLGGRVYGTEAYQGGMDLGRYTNPVLQSIKLSWYGGTFATNPIGSSEALRGPNSGIETPDNPDDSNSTVTVIVGTAYYTEGAVYDARSGKWTVDLTIPSGGTVSIEAGTEPPKPDADGKLTLEEILHEVESLAYRDAMGNLLFPWAETVAEYRKGCDEGQLAGEMDPANAIVLANKLILGKDTQAPLMVRDVIGNIYSTAELWLQSTLGDSYSSSNAPKRYGQYDPGLKEGVGFSGTQTPGNDSGSSSDSSSGQLPGGGFTDGSASGIF